MSASMIRSSITASMARDEETLKGASGWGSVNGKGNWFKRHFSYFSIKSQVGKKKKTPRLHLWPLNLNLGSIYVLMRCWAPSTPPEATAGRSQLDVRRRQKPLGPELSAAGGCRAGGRGDSQQWERHVCSPEARWMSQPDSKEESKSVMSGHVRTTEE